MMKKCQSKKNLRLHEIVIHAALCHEHFDLKVEQAVLHLYSKIASSKYTFKPALS